MTALPPDAQRYLGRMRSLEPPVELVDSIMAEVEATPQVRSGSDLRAMSTFVLAAAAVLLAIAVLLRIGAQDVGPAPTPVPLDQLPSAGSVQARISIEASDVPAAFGHEFLWLTNATTGELVRMDPANGSIASPLQVTRAGGEVAIAISESSVWVADRRDATVVELDPATLEERRRIPVTATVSAVATLGADLWLLDTGAGQLVRFDTADAGAALTVPVDGPSALLIHDGAVWVADELGELVRIDPASGDETGRVDLGFAVMRLVPDGGSLLAVGGAADLVARIDIGSMRVSARGVRAPAIAVEGGRVWAVTASGYLVSLDPATLQPLAASALELDASGTLAFGGGLLWTTGVDAAGDAYLLKVVPQP